MAHMTIEHQVYRAWSGNVKAKAAEQFESMTFRGTGDRVSWSFRKKPIESQFRAETNPSKANFRAGFKMDTNSMECFA